MILSLQNLFFKYSLVLFYDLTFKIWYGDENTSLETATNTVNGGKIPFFDQIIKILEYLEA